MGLGVKTKMNTKMRGRKRKHPTSDSYSDSDSDSAMEFTKFPSSTQTQPLPAAFRDRVKEFLETQAVQTPPDSAAAGVAVAWRVPLRLRLRDGSQSPLPLFVFEEDVTLSSRSLYCDHCRVVGWSGHPVCRKRYHFIIKTTKTTELSVLELELELEDTTHLLHAVVHSNGFGHLLTLNGRQGGSPHLSGGRIMDFWDRLSRSLSVRKITVMDVSRKYGVDYRLLHAVARGRSWYANWGYDFVSGSFALTGQAYLLALLSLSAVPLSPFLLSRPRALCPRLRAVVSLYRSLSLVELANFGDLFSFLFDLVAGVVQSSSGVLCAWTRGDVERLQQAMVKVLRASRSGWVARWALKGALCKAASSLQLLDYCLKHFGGTVTSDGFVVHSRCNPSSAVIEYRLEPLSCKDSNVESNRIDVIYPSEEQVLCDLKFLYDSLLNPDTVVEDIPQMLRDRVVDSATKVLDCKQFVKVYVPENLVDGQDMIRLWCDVQLLDQPKGKVAIPAELVVLPSNATVGDLKRAVTHAFQEVYVMLKTFQAEGLAEYGSVVDDSMTLKFLVGSSGSVQLNGKCASKHGLSRFRMERGVESWTVKCSCGAVDDDGERMLACDTCGVWQHTRCVGIAKSDAIPAEFVCLRCAYLCTDDLLAIGGSSEDVFSASLSKATCRGKVAALGGFGLTLTTNLAIASDVR